MSSDAPPPTPSLEAYAAANGLLHRAASFGLPKATQILRHGFMLEVPSLASGDLPGSVGNGWLAQVDYAYETRSDIERSRFTLVLVEAPERLGFARVLCHDRGLSDRDRANPDADREVVELDDRVIKLESEGFLRRFALSTDHDQDQLEVWQLFDPTLIDWLTDSAPAGFSFELQDGALACFVPGWTAEQAELDSLCAAAGRVFDHIAGVTAGAGAGVIQGGEPSRASMLDEELAAHHFDEPPDTVKVAAKAYRSGLRLGEHAWKLGAEAFFREHARALGFEPITLSEFRSSHLQTVVVGEISHVAAGRLAGATVDAHLVFSELADYDDQGWSSLLAPVTSPAALAVGAAYPRRADERGEIGVNTDGRTLFISAVDGGRDGRTAADLAAFIAAATPLLAQL